MNKKNTNKTVKITISNEAYDMLSNIARAMNGVKWCEEDNTVASLIEEFCIGSEMDIDMVKENIVGAIDTGCEEGSKKDTSRRNAIRRAIEKVAV